MNYLPWNMFPMISCPTMKVFTFKLRHCSTVQKKWTHCVICFVFFRNFNEISWNEISLKRHIMYGMGYEVQHEISCTCFPHSEYFFQIMMTSSNGNIFRVTCPLYGELTGQRWIPLTKANDAELWFCFYFRLNKRLSKRWRRWSFETPSRSL